VVVPPQRVFCGGIHQAASLGTILADAEKALWLIDVWRLNRKAKIGRKMVNDPAVLEHAGAANEADGFGTIQTNVSPIRGLKGNMAEDRLGVPVGWKAPRNLHKSLDIADICVVAYRHNEGMFRCLLALPAGLPE
jgi:hypothetical protein